MRKPITEVSGEGKDKFERCVIAQGFDSLTVTHLFSFGCNTMIEILTDNENRYIHYLGYGYFADDDEKPYRLVDYTGFYVLLEEVLEVGINRYEIDNSESITQYITDMTEDEFDKSIERENHPLLKEEDISMETPDGLYWIEYKES